MTTQAKPLTEHTVTFDAMGTQVLVIVASEAGLHEVAQAIDDVRSLFTREEARFTRFTRESELSRMNANGGTDRPSDEMWDVLQRARGWWEWSGGAFDPTILSALEASGYDRTFADVDGSGVRMTPSLRRTFADVRLIEGASGRQVVLPDGLRLDLGGIVKGWTVDRAVDLLTGFSGCLVDAGGDIRVKGDSADGAGWPVGLEEPSEMSANRWAVWVCDGAVATSGTYRRRWDTASGLVGHHIIDPVTGAPSRSDLSAVTVVAPTAEASEVIAKVALIGGSARALNIIGAFSGAEGLLTGNDGAWIFSPRWKMNLVGEDGGVL